MRDHAGQNVAFSVLESNVKQAKSELNHLQDIQEQLVFADPPALNQQITAYNAKADVLKKQRKTMSQTDAASVDLELNNEFAEIDKKKKVLSAAQANQDMAPYIGKPAALAAAIEEQTDKVDDAKLDNDAIKDVLDTDISILKWCYPFLFLLSTGLFVRLANLGWKNIRVSNTLLKRFYLYQFSSISLILACAITLLSVTSIIAILLLHVSPWWASSDALSWLVLPMLIGLTYWTVRRWNKRGVERLRPFRILIAWLATNAIGYGAMMTGLLFFSGFFLRYKYPEVFDRFAEVLQDAMNS